MFRNRNTTAGLVRRLLDGLTLRRVGLIVLGAMICTFGIHNIHQQTGITEGGVMGLMLLVEHWLGVSPAFITPVLDITCYLLAFKYLGGRFIKISAVSTLSVSLFYKVCELFPPMLPDLSAPPLAAALLGGVVGATRPAIEDGWVSRAHQVGQSGKIVAPALYIACGVSGATQHVSGMSGSGYVVAINKDEDAPIFDVADVGIVGDVAKVLPLMIEEIRQRKAE